MIYGFKTFAQVLELINPLNLHVILCSYLHLFIITAYNIHPEMIKYLYQISFWTQTNSAIFKGFKHHPLPRFIKNIIC